MVELDGAPWRVIGAAAPLGTPQSPARHLRRTGSRAAVLQAVVRTGTDAMRLSCQRAEACRGWVPRCCGSGSSVLSAGRRQAELSLKPPISRRRPLRGAPAEFQHVKPGKGAAFVRSKLKNQITGNSVERTFRAGEMIGTADVSKSDAQFTYNDGADVRSLPPLPPSPRGVRVPVPLRSLQ